MTLLGFEVLTAVSTKIAVFWAVTLCTLVIALMMEAAITSKSLVNFYQTTRRYNPEDSYLSHDIVKNKGNDFLEGKVTLLLIFLYRNLDDTGQLKVQRND
jgi:hypothetical protein